MIARSARRFGALALLAAAAIAVGPSRSHAAFTVTLSEVGFADRVIADGSAGDSAGIAGLIVANGNYGTYLITAQIASSNASYGITPASLTINQLAIQTIPGLPGPPGTLNPLVITVKDTGFTVPAAGPGVLSSQLSTTSLSAGGGVTFQSFVNGVGGTILSLGLPASGTGPITDGVTIGAAPYTMSSVTTVTLLPNGTIQSTGTTTLVTPEPGTMALVFTALPFAGLGLWRRLRNKA